MESPEYNDNYNEGKRDRKKKKHRRAKEETNEDEMYNDYNGPTMAYEDQPQPIIANTRKSEEENFDPSQAPRRKHRSKPKKREEEYEEEPEPLYEQGRHYDENVNSPVVSYDNEMVSRKPKKDRKKKSRDMTDDGAEDHYLNINPQSPNGNNQNYPFDDPDESIQLEEHYQEEESIHTDEQSNKNETPDKTKAKKKSGGFMKIFASFKKKNKTKQPESNGHTKQWQSNPEIFNPAYDSQPNTMERSTKKISGKSSRNIPTHKAQVILLDGMEVEFDTDQKMLGKELFEQCCTYLDLIEKDFFGMTYVNSKLQTWFWLEIDKKISKQLNAGDDWIFNFQVKFYPPEPVLLQEDITRYLLSLQVRQDVFTGKLPCSWITQALLGSFMVQSELGDYDELEHGEGIEYLQEFEFVLNQSDQLLEKISELHKKHIGMPPDKADVKYLETAKRLEQYGVDLHPARDNDDVEIFIGVCYQGVLIYRDRLRIGRFAWPKVLRISYKKNYFYLKIRSDRYDDSVAIVGFKLFNHNLAKRLWKNAVEQHTFFRMKEPQNSKTMPRMIPSSSSTYNYSGKTLHQYRSMNISRNEPLKFDRSVTKRRTIGSMPAGLERTGMQYSSMHSLNRSHPRDMTMGKTKSIEYLSAKRPGSNIGVGQGSNSNLRMGVQQKYPPYGQTNSYRDDDRHLSFQSGDSLNAAESYIVRNDDQVSLPPMPSLTQPDHNRQYKKKDTKSSRPTDVLSDDGLNLQTNYSKPHKKSNSKAPVQVDMLSDDGINAQLEYNNKPLKKQNSKPVRPVEEYSDDNTNSQPIYAVPLKKTSKTSRPPVDNLSDDGVIPQPIYSKPLKKQSSRSRKSHDDLSDEEINSQPVHVSRSLKKQNSKNKKPKDDLSDEDSVPIVMQDKVRQPNKTNKSNINLPDPVVDTSLSEEVESSVRVSKKLSSHHKQSGSINLSISQQSRPQAPNQFRPPPPPPEPISHIRSNSSSERSSPMEHNLPPPPPIEIEIPKPNKPKPPPVKPKPAVKPKPKIILKDHLTITKHSSRYDDESSNDDML